MSPDAPPFEAASLGIIETAKNSSSFGYSRNQQQRLVLLSVELENRERVVIADPPVTGVPKPLAKAQKLAQQALVNRSL